MEIVFLGTAAAEAWPAPFCRCMACNIARRNGGKDIRTRSGVLIDGVFKVDFGPDTFSQMQREGRDLWALTTLVFTHPHDDHFTPTELQYRRQAFVSGDPPAQLAVYGNPDVMNALRRLYDDPAAIRANFGQPLEPFAPVATADGSVILPLPAAHTAGALLLRIARDDKVVLYGHDTGPFPEETVEALAGTTLDLAILDCTYGAAGQGTGRHMGVPENVRTVERLRGVGAVTPKTRLVATHLSHHGGLLHDELAATLHPLGFDLAYDGMIVHL